MKAYIDKTAVVAEIERRTKAYQENFDKADNKIAKLFADGLIQGLESFLAFLDTFEVKEVKEEPVSNDLEEAAHSYVDTTIEWFDSEGNPCCYPAFKAGAQWQREQMEKNRIEHCGNITEEQYNLETGFLDDFLDKNKRMPTFLDAIEYGMKKAQKGE